jgi:predicted nucleic acid-binding protein
MSELCVDASIVVKLVLHGEPHRPLARKLVQDALANQVALIAPPYFEAEVDTVICKRLHSGRLSVREARAAFVGLDKVPVQLLTDPQLRQHAREFAERFNQHTVYDCTYAALAELRGCDFWTADKVFYDAVKSALSFVKYLPDYS